MKSLIASVLVILGIAVGIAGIVYWQPDGWAGVVLGLLIIGLGVLAERADGDDTDGTAPRPGV
jgi:cytochrome c biogenesis protein CcdA